MITIKEEFVGSVKWRRAIKLGGADVILLWLAMKRYVAETLSNGFVPDDELDALPGAPERPRDALRVLLECGKTREDGSRGAGLVDPHPHGWQLHDYLDHANSAEQEAVRRERERKRKADYRAGLRTGQSRGTDEGQPDGTVRGTTGAASRPGARVLALARANPTQPNPTQPVNQAAAGEAAERIPCPADLALTEAQRATLITGGIPESTFADLELSFRGKHAAAPDDKRTLETWLKCLSRHVTSNWRSALAESKRGTEHGTAASLRKGGPRQPSVYGHLDDEAHASTMGATLE